MLRREEEDVVDWVCVRRKVDRFSVCFGQFWPGEETFGGGNGTL